MTKLFAIGDLHMSETQEKPMSVFGKQWEGHIERIEENWKRKVSAQDIVIIPGDISWAMQLTQAMLDLNRVATWPGKKVLLRGNHDYWWSSIAKIRKALPADLFAIQNDALLIDDVVIGGTRGWTLPFEGVPFSAEDDKILKRELLRLEISLHKMMAMPQAKKRVVALHFPPTNQAGDATPFTTLLQQYPIDHVVYGHLHGNGIHNGFTGEIGGVQYHLTSCDALQFTPLLID